MDEIDLVIVCRKWLHFSVEDRHWFGFRVEVGNDLFFASGSKLTVFFLSGDRNRLDIRVGIEIYLISVLVSKLTWFYLRDRNSLGFSVGIDLDLFFVQESKSNSVLCAGRTWPGFNLWIEIHVVDSVGIEVDLDFACGPKMTRFSVGMDWLSFCAGGRIWLDFCMLAEYNWC